MPGLHHSQTLVSTFESVRQCLKSLKEKGFVRSGKIPCVNVVFPCVNVVLATEDKHFTFEDVLRESRLYGFFKFGQVIALVIIIQIFLCLPLPMKTISFFIGRLFSVVKRASFSDMHRRILPSLYFESHFAPWKCSASRAQADGGTTSASLG